MTASGTVGSFGGRGTVGTLAGYKAKEPLAVNTLFEKLKDIRCPKKNILASICFGSLINTHSTLLRAAGMLHPIKPVKFHTLRQPIPKTHFPLILPYLRLTASRVNGPRILLFLASAEARNVPTALQKQSFSYVSRGGLQRRSIQPPTRLATHKPQPAPKPNKSPCSNELPLELFPDCALTADT